MMETKTEIRVFEEEAILPICKECGHSNYINKFCSDCKANTNYLKKRKLLARFTLRDIKFFREQGYLSRKGIVYLESLETSEVQK